MIKWGGHLVLWIGAGHLILGVALTAGAHADDWISGAMWGLGGSLTEPAAVEGAFWFSLGSFGLPLALCGAMVLWLDHRGDVPPAFLGWALLAWSLAAGALYEPAPWFIVWIAAGLLLAGARRARRNQSLGRSDANAGTARLFGETVRRDMGRAVRPGPCRVISNIGCDRVSGAPRG